MSEDSKTYTIAELARKLGFTPAYVRMLIRKKLLESSLEPIAPGANVTRHIVTEEDLNDYLTGSKRRSKRTDGRNKYVFYATPGEHDQVIVALDAANLHQVVESLRTANKLKPQMGGSNGV